MTIKTKYMLMGIALLTSVSANATQAQFITFSGAMGHLGGKAGEYVFDPVTGYKKSQLNWKIKNARIIKGELNWDIFNSVSLNARGWTTVNAGDGHMEDYDWADPIQSAWTHQSVHPDTTLNYANEFDLNGRYWLLNNSLARAGLVAGYQQSRFSWTAKGGTYNYLNGMNNGTFPSGQLVAGYKQTFSAPYIGLAGRYRYKYIDSGFLFKFSPWVSARDNDEHYLRGLTFRDKGNNIKLYSLSADVGYFLTPLLRLFTEISYTAFSLGKGETVIIDNAAQQHATVRGNAAGMDNASYNIVAGFSFIF